MNDPKIIVALDFDNLSSAKNLVSKLTPTLCKVKIGKELFTSCGPEVVKFVQDKGFDVFLDLKFHDIPATTAKACKAAADLGVWMINVHALGGSEMMEAARKTIDSCGAESKLIAVTILTSHDESTVKKLGFSNTLDEQVDLLANMARDANLDGVVCSAKEAEKLRSNFGKDFLLVTPGIRPEGVALNDQKRAVIPEMAIKNGSNYLVIGRPITQAKDPCHVLEMINRSIKK